MSGGPIYRRDGDVATTIEGLAALIGEASLAVLSRRFGGRRIYVPAELHPGHELVVLLGLGAAQALTHHLAGVTLSVPMEVASPAERRRRVVEMNGRGFTRAQIAEKVGMTERRVYQILEDADAPPAQPTLL